MEFLQNLTIQDLKDFLGFKPEFKNQDRLNVIPLNEPFSYIVSCNGYRLTLQITEKEKILINGEESIEYSAYFMAFLLRIYGDSYKEYYLLNRVKEKFSHAMVYAPFGLPEGFPIEEVKQTAGEQAYNIIYPRLKIKLDDFENKGKMVWPNLQRKDNPLT